MQSTDRNWVGRVPNDVFNRLPLPVKKIEKQTGGENERAPLNRGRHNLRQSVFESLSSHYAVLDGKQAQQNTVDDQRLQRRPGHTGIDRFWNTDVGYKSDRVEERDEEDQIRDHAVGESQRTLHKVPPAGRMLPKCDLMSIRSSGGRAAGAAGLWKTWIWRPRPVLTSSITSENLRQREVASLHIKDS